MRNMYLAILTVTLLSGLPLAAQSLDPPASGHRHASLTDIRASIAWYGALCLMDAPEIDLYGDVFSIASLAEETGVPMQAIRDVGQARGAEHAVAVVVLRAGGEPLRDPPEPFLSLMRETQSDCQNFQQRRNILEREIARGALPETAPQPASTPLRAALDPVLFDRDRARRMGYVLAAVDEVRAAGEFVDELLEVARLISGQADLTLDDIAGIVDQQERTWIATELLLPNPGDITDLSEAEAVELVARFTDVPDGRFARYYVSLVVANLDHLGEDILTGGTNSVLIFRAEPTTPVCRRIANSAALRCDQD